MSTATSLMTFAEFERLPDIEGYKRELVSGQIIIMPPAKHTHSVIGRRIQFILWGRLDRELVFGDGTGYRIGAENWLVPDVSIAWPNQTIDESDYFVGAPMIAVEVLSPEKRNTSLKTKSYLAGGAREVWVIDPDSRSLTAHVKRGDDVLWDTFDRKFISEAAGITIELDEIFR